LENDPDHNVGTVSKGMDISSHFLTVRWGIFLVFEPRRRYRISRDTPSVGGVKLTEMVFFTILQFRFLSQKRYEIYSWNTNRKS